jgi:hypothetical protein
MATRAGSRALLEFGLHPIIQDATGTEIDPAFGPESWDSPISRTGPCIAQRASFAGQTLRPIELFLFMDEEKRMTISRPQLHACCF